MRHNLNEMEGQRWELVKWMTLMATTTTAMGDCNQGTMASGFGRTPTLSSLSWTRTGGEGAEARGVDQTTTIIALIINWFDNDGGGKIKLAIIVDGKTYRVVELRRGAVVKHREEYILS